MGRVEERIEHRAEWAFYWWMRGYTIAEIAEAFGVTTPSAWYYIEKKRNEKQIWHRERPALKYDENWRQEDG